jgi:hypothetical protein
MLAAWWLLVKCSSLFHAHIGQARPHEWSESQQSGLACLQVLHACALGPDLAALTASDLTPVGDHGCRRAGGAGTADGARKSPTRCRVATG